MGQSLPFSSLPFDPPTLSERQLEQLRDKVRDAADVMTDDQILCLADSLHDTLRARRALRGRVHQRVEERLCHENATPFPY